MKKALVISISIVLALGVAFGILYYTGIIKIGDDKKGENLIESEGLAFEYKQDTDTYEVTGLGECEDTNIVIPKTYQGKAVASINGKAFSHSNIESLVVQGSVKVIGSGNMFNSAFDRCSSLKTVVIKEGVEQVGERAFQHCTELVSAKLPNSLSVISSYMFTGCLKLSSVEIGNNVTKIGSSAFYNCKSLKTITYNGSKTSWGAIEKDSGWKEYVPADCVVKCTDGDINI